ncbi:hypothetical protein EVAR_27895_1 [Eumeta japonica]|uniref:Uncharacterized protein n=1 Tax=Eumeta variegata TaxID=151549 RepID=A0A4C1UUV5_EUMVA|nr:hypothetical protein EVAR_27895_1 [Eumeta japonica]
MGPQRSEWMRGHVSRRPACGAGAGTHTGTSLGSARDCRAHAWARPSRHPLAPRPAAGRTATYIYNRRKPFAVTGLRR